ncbi:MAG: hypothetical protein P3W94_003445 [Paracoccus sp. (in: a-proteobacteria)]|nr:hypothetical protein [Paracoccus sp. (in: a-proteobacteria)]
MSHNHEPERAARRHKPAMIANALALATALIVFFIFLPGVVEDVGDGIATTPPPADVSTTSVEGTEEEPAVAGAPDAEPPADAFEEQQQEPSPAN